jgi:hypothetical protein
MTDAATDELGNSSAPAPPTSLASMSLADLDWIENWLIQKRGTEHAARPYGKGYLLLTTLIFEVRRERRHRADVRGMSGTAIPGQRRPAYDFSGPFEDVLNIGEGSSERVPSETEQIKRGERTGVIVGLGLPLLIIAAVVAGLMWWHTGGVLPQ